MPNSGTKPVNKIYIFSFLTESYRGMQTHELKIVTGGRKEWGHLNQIQIRSREGVLQEETLMMDWIKVPGKSVKRKMCVRKTTSSVEAQTTKGLFREKFQDV